MLQTPQAARRVVLLLAACAILATLASSSVMHDALLQLLSATQRVIESNGVLAPVAFVVLAALSAMLAFMSVAVIVPAAVFAWGTPASMGLLWLGWILGGAASYTIGRHLGRRVVRWLTADEALNRLERHLAPETPV